MYQSQMILLIIRWGCSITGTTDTLFVSKEQIKTINWNEILCFLANMQLYLLSQISSVLYQKNT